MPVIANTTIIANFAGVRRLEFLRLLWPRLYISEQVLEEVRKGLLQGYDFYAGIEMVIFPFSDTGWLHLTTLQTLAELRLYGELSSTLHSGEASCLSIAYHRQWTFLSDDKAARKVSADFRIPVSGTLGILLSLTKRHLLTMAEADTVLQNMIQIGYYSPVSSLKEII
jgi:predicted nucleic acid-binding protein